jgi:hypothetical protein
MGNWVTRRAERAGCWSGLRGSARTQRRSSRAIDDHEVAVVAARDDLVIALDEEALQRERRVDPRPVEVRDEHSHLELGGEDFGRHSPTF